MEAVELYICQSTSIYFEYAFDCVYLEFQKRYIIQKQIYEKQNVNNQQEQIKEMINISNRNN